MATLPVEFFGDLVGLPIRHGFVGRIPGIDVNADRETALQRLEQHHEQIRQVLDLGAHCFATAQQVHGADAAVVDSKNFELAPEVDALVTNDPRVCLGIYVADCAPVWLVDPVERVIGCAHSGRKGSELGVVPSTVRKMSETFGSRPSNIVVQVGPCIRPPSYEVDFAAMIRQQCQAMGLAGFSDCGTCTAANPERYYSYRRELGKTGRMLAFLALK